jgi:general secretion pathway protein K
MDEPPPMHRSRIRRQAGVALVFVLWMLVFMTLMAGGYSATTRTETRVAAAHLQAAQARAVAEAGVWHAIYDLAQPGEGAAVPVDGTARTVAFGPGRFTIRIQDEAGKADLNTARPEILEGLLEAAGVAAEERASLLDAILDWRDADHDVRSSGAEDASYRAAGLEYGAKDGPFNSVDELLRVMGMTEEIYLMLQPSLSVHSRQSGINRAVASGTVLRSAGVDEERMGEHFSLRGGNRGAPAARPDMSRDHLATRHSGTMTLTSEGMVEGTIVRLEVVVRLERRSNPPVSILSWLEAIPGERAPATDEAD